MDEPTASLALRSQLLHATVQAFRPNAIIVDYLPLGIDDELTELMFGLPDCKKYFISRGILGSPTGVRTEVFTPMALQALRKHFHKLIVMSDRKIIDSVSEYNLDPTLAGKLEYAGYSVNQPPEEDIKAIRQLKSLSSASRWVVCSAGGGKDGEDLIQKCWEISNFFPDVQFDIVVGPRSRLTLTRSAAETGRVRIVDAKPNSLALMHAAADVVITRGGYNSLMEASVGRAQLIVVPISSDFEQQEHGRRLSAYRKLEIVHDLDDLDLALEAVLLLGPAQALTQQTLRLDGAMTAARIIIDDLLPPGTNTSIYQQDSFVTAGGIR